MIPITFPQVNTIFGPPPELDESQCRKVPAYAGTVAGGSMDGSAIIVVAWQPGDEDRKRINEGKPVYLTVVGGLVIHMLSTTFEEAIKPS